MRNNSRHNVLSGRNQTFFYYSYMKTLIWRANKLLAITWLSSIWLSFIWITAKTSQNKLSPSTNWQTQVIWSTSYTKIYTRKMKWPMTSQPIVSTHRNHQSQHKNTSYKWRLVVLPSSIGLHQWYFWCHGFDSTKLARRHWMDPENKMSIINDTVAAMIYHCMDQRFLLS